MPTVIATPKAVDANSYVTRADATSYFDLRLNSSDWTSASDSDKDRAIIMATRMLDSLFEWSGWPRTVEQALRWPRSGVMDEDGDALDYDTIPTRIEEATCETALFLLKGDRLAEPVLLGQGFSSAAVGPLTVTVDPSQVLPYIPKHVIPMLTMYGVLKPEANRTGDRSVPVWRV